jgi:hypothetical protein
MYLYHIRGPPTRNKGSLLLKGQEESGFWLLSSLYCGSVAEWFIAPDL